MTTDPRARKPVWDLNVYLSKSHPLVMESTSPIPIVGSRGRGRGGRGKAIRARGRGGRGRAANFAPRLVLSEEQPLNEEEEEERQREIREKYARRELTSNAHRYEDPPPDNSNEQDAEEEPEPEVDLSGFLERQKLEDRSPGLFLTSQSGLNNNPAGDGDDGVDHSLDHFNAGTSKPSRKGKIEVVEWTAETEAMKQAKDEAEAVWDLKQRLKGNMKVSKPSSTPSVRSKESKTGAKVLEDLTGSGPKNDEEFLDDLLT